MTHVEHLQGSYGSWKVLESHVPGLEIQAWVLEIPVIRPGSRKFLEMEIADVT